MREDETMEQKSKLARITTCNRNHLRMPLKERAGPGGQHTLVECLSKQPCEMRVERNEKASVCMGLWSVDK